VKISRVRKGSKNELSRNARNASRYNEISKEEEDMVMNLPTTLKRTGAASSDSDDDEHPSKQSHASHQLRNKTKDIFQLKDVND
jgi:cell wall assembly regulator SMI1